MSATGTGCGQTQTHTLGHQQLSPPVSCHRLSDWYDSQTVTRRNTAALHTAELQLNCELHSRRNLQHLPADSKGTTLATAETRNCTSKSCRQVQRQNAIDRAGRIRLCFEFDRQLSQSITREWKERRDNRPRQRLISSDLRPAACFCPASRNHKGAG